MKNSELAGYEKSFRDFVDLYETAIRSENLVQKDACIKCAEVEVARILEFISRAIYEMSQC